MRCEHSGPFCPIRHKRAVHLIRKQFPRRVRVIGHAQMPLSDGVMLAAGSRAPRSVPRVCQHRQKIGDLASVELGQVGVKPRRRRRLDTCSPITPGLDWPD